MDNASNTTDANHLNFNGKYLTHKKAKAKAITIAITIGKTKLISYFLMNTRKSTIFFFLIETFNRKGIYLWQTQYDA